MKRFIAVLLATVFCVPLFDYGAAAAGKTLASPADGVNVTRWADLMIVYKDIPSTGQNEWGYNVVVDSSFRVTDIIKPGSSAGKDLPVPEGGMIISASGTKVQWLEENINIGDYVFYDHVTGRVMVSDTDSFDLTFSINVPITDFNAVRYAGKLVIYDKGTTTGTNSYGYEFTVGKDGIIKSSGGNDSQIPDGGYVVSAIEPDDKLLLKTYGVPGAVCRIADDKKTLTIAYGADEMKSAAVIKYNALLSDLAKAKEKCLIVDFQGIALALTEAEKLINGNAFAESKGRNILNSLFMKAQYMLAEPQAAEIRAVWHEPTEKTAVQVEKVVKNIADANLNQLCLGITNGIDTIIPLPESSPFHGKERALRIDLLDAYISACHKYGVELILSVSVFRNNKAQLFPEWQTVTNSGEGEEKVFFSPASDGFTKALTNYIAHILENYDIDGLQLDYIRYPYFDGTVDYGYDSETLDKFVAYSGCTEAEAASVGKELTGSPLWNKWIEFKSGLVSACVGELSRLVREKRPDIFFSVCLASETNLQSYYQNGGEWAASGLVDAVYPMSYAVGIVAGDTQKFSSFGNNYYCVTGSGSYLSLSREEQLCQVLEERANGGNGIAFFEYISYFAHGYNEILKLGAFSQKAVSPQYSASDAVSACIARIVQRAEIAASQNLADQSLTEKLSAAGDSLDKIKTILDGESGAWKETALADLEYARKASLLSKDSEKEAANKKEESSAEESSEISEISKDESKTTNDNKNVFPYIAAAAGIAFAAATAGIIVIKKKKRK